mgnify:CR=1 FL=1
MLLVSKDTPASDTARMHLRKKAQTAFQHIQLPVNALASTCFFTTVQAAIDAATSSYRKALDAGIPWSGECIWIEKGLYQEQVTIQTPHLTLLGEDAEETRISYALYGYMPSPDIGKLGTFRSYTMLIDADQVQLYNLTVENTAGAGPDIGQAIALYADGDALTFDHIYLRGWQDTLFTGPLPPKEIEKNGFIGPKQYAPRRNGRQYYHHCWIEGDIDFIFGSATAYFEECTIYQKDRAKLDVPAPSPRGFATAASTPEGQTYGYVFDHCRFLSDCPSASCFLGRPWRNFAQVVILHSYLGPHIHPAGFHNWNKEDAEATVQFLEYQNEGPGARRDGCAPFVRELSDAEAAAYTRKRVVPFVTEARGPEGVPSVTIRRAR